MIEGNYLALVYNDGKVFKLFGGMNDLPDGFDKQHVKPVTFAEFMYSQVYDTTDSVSAITTRFPVTGFWFYLPNQAILEGDTRIAEAFTP